VITPDLKVDLEVASRVDLVKMPIGVEWSSGAMGYQAASAGEEGNRGDGQWRTHMYDVRLTGSTGRAHSGRVYLQKVACCRMGAEAQGHTRNLEMPLRPTVTPAGVGPKRTGVYKGLHGGF
jgi:hypothetical protein